MNTIISNIVKMPNLWGGVVPLQIFGIVSLYFVFTGLAISYWWLFTIVGYVCIMMLGVSGCYHRLLCHKSFSVNRYVKCIMLWFGAISVQGSPIFWAAVHRGYHHRYADKEKDPHSPVHGFWHSYIGWQFTLTEGSISVRAAADLLRDKDVMFFHKYYKWILWISHLLLILISFQIWLFLMLFPAFIAFHSYSIQTSLTHIKSVGYQNTVLDNNSVNSVYLFPLVLGDAWHNNHHADPKNPNFGGKKWWEIDPTYFLIKIIRRN